MKILAICKQKKDCVVGDWGWNLLKCQNMQKIEQINYEKMNNMTKQ